MAGGFARQPCGALLLRACLKRVLGAELPRLLRSILARFLVAAAVMEDAGVQRLGRRGSPGEVEVEKAA